MSHGSTGFVHSPEDKETQDVAGMEIPSFDQALVPMHEGSMGIINLVLILLAVHVCARLVGEMWYVVCNVIFPLITVGWCVEVSAE